MSRYDCLVMPEGSSARSRMKSDRTEPMLSRTLIPSDSARFEFGSASTARTGVLPARTRCRMISAAVVVFSRAALSGDCYYCTQVKSPLSINKR